MTRRLGLVALAALAVLPYVAGIRNPLLYDDRTLLDNRWLAAEAGPVSVFTHDYWHGTRHERSDLYRPLTVLSLAANLRIAPSREAFHAVNIALHAACTLAAFGFLAAIAPRRAAWMGAALFAVHPLGSEAVLWAVGRAEIAAALLGMAAFVLFARLDDRPGPGGVRLAASAGAFFAALCFKESAAAWLAVGAAWLALRPRGRGVAPRVVAARAAAYGAALAGYAALRVAAVGWDRTPVPFVDNPLSAADPVTRAANAAALLARYVVKMAAPWTLSIEYGFDQIPVRPLFPWSGAVGLIVVGLFVASVVAFKRRGHTAAAFLVAFVPCAFAVTGNFFFPIGTIFGERLAYTPLIGFCGLAGLALDRVPKPGWRAGVVVALLAAGTARTALRCGDFRDVATLSEATAAASPRAVKALVNAARTRLRAGHPADAIPLLERAVAIWPEYARARQLLEEARSGAAVSAADDPGP